MTKPEFNDDHELDRGRDHELTILSKEDKTEIFHTRDYIRLIRYLIRDMHRNEDLNTTIGNIDKVNFVTNLPPEFYPQFYQKICPLHLSVNLTSRLFPFSNLTQKFTLKHTPKFTPNLPPEIYLYFYPSKFTLKLNPNLSI